MNGKKAKQVVTIGGGSGHYALLAGLRDVANIDLTAIVSMADNGGSSGRLRDEHGVLPPGDILKCLIALAQNREAANALLLRRFRGRRRLSGHVLGNLLVTILCRYTEDFAGAVAALAEALDIRGRVLPVTTDRATLSAELENGRWLHGETVIDRPRGVRPRIRRVVLTPHHGREIRAYRPARAAVLAADVVIIGPGDLYTSIIPNFLVKGMAGAMAAAHAKIVYIANIMTKRGETDGFRAADFVDCLEKSCGRRLDVAIFNTGRPGRRLLDRYRREGAVPVSIGRRELPGRLRVVKADLLSGSGPIARHDSPKLARLLKRVIF